MKYYYENALGDEGLFYEKDLIKAIYTAWNIDATLYIQENNNWKIIFSPLEDNEFNSDLLELYGYKMIDGEIERQIIDLKTNKVVKYDWSEVQQLI